MGIRWFECGTMNDFAIL